MEPDPETAGTAGPPERMLPTPTPSSATFDHDRNPIETGYDGDTLYAASCRIDIELDEDIYPASPTQNKRYKSNRKVEDTNPSHAVDPMRISFEDGGLPEGWLRHVHPEGLPYFYRPRSEDCPMRVVTDEWLYTEEIASCISECVQKICTAIFQRGINVHPESDLVIELTCIGEKSWKYGYYFAHHPTRYIYWLQEVELEYQSKYFSEDVRGKTTNSQAGICLELEYWAYWDLFPNIQEITPNILNFAVSNIASAMADVVSSSDATVTFTKKELKNMLKIVEIAKDYHTSNWHIGRFMKQLLGDRLRYYYGTYSARLTRGQSVLDTQPEKPSKFMTLLSPVLFFIPHAQLERVEPLVIDRSVIVMHWRKFSRELQDEWEQTMTLATIMLAANCAFLAIPLFQADDESSSSINAHSSPAQIASYFSLDLSLFGLILGMVMYRQHKDQSPNTPSQILSHILNTTECGPVKRLEHLVLIWSLPHALVIWSVVTFFIAFLLVCFTGTLTTTRTLVALSTALLSSLVLYYTLRFGSGRKFLDFIQARFFSRENVESGSDSEDVRSLTITETSSRV